MDIFEKASREKLRFLISNPSGSVSTEELWGRKWENLIQLESEIEEGLSKFARPNRKTRSVITKEQELQELRLKIVSYIIDDMEAKSYESVKNLEIKKQDQEILEVLEEKRKRAMAAMNEEELLKLLSKNRK